jgi:hypothetical protein
MRRIETNLGAEAALSSPRDGGSPAIVHAVIRLGWICSLVASPVAAAPPIPLSPGDAVASGLVEAPCPTFSWGGVGGGVDGVELVVLRVSSETHGEPELVWRRTLPADARSFTPPLPDCLERGERYAWSVAATRDGDPAPVWSPPLLFQVDEGSNAHRSSAEESTAVTSSGAVERLLSSSPSETAAAVAGAAPTAAESPSRADRALGKSTRTLGSRGSPRPASRGMSTSTRYASIAI